MFRLDMQAIRQKANTCRLMANPANLANLDDARLGEVEKAPEISQEGPELAGLATLAISHGSPELLMARLISAAMRVCDRHGDDERARQQMRDECAATPAHLQTDLLAHFRGTPAFDGRTDAYPPEGAV